MNDTTLNVTKARERWGQAAPEWIVVLAQACDSTSQSAVSKRLGISNSMISTALQNAYPGRMDKLEQRVRGEYMNQRVACPVLGDITSRKCLDSQAWVKNYAPTNGMRVELRRACVTCPNASGNDREAA